MSFSYGFPCVSRNMNMRRTPARRIEENDVNEGLPPIVDMYHKLTKFLKVLKVLELIKSLLWKD